ncbi:MAG: ribonucleotide-diphosphate reductase subunit beta [Actinomycetota bacterium]|nr:ribonucleotide-diphosphate reductase subunit beta [Actinomycetota bacterium]
MRGLAGREGAGSVPDEERRKRELVYERLYREWEESHWSATAIDFTADARHWREVLDEQQREASLWNYALFLEGVTRVSRSLTAVLDAAPSPAHALFVSSQIVDEARNRMFLDRFMREVAGKGHDPTSTSEALEHYMTWGFRQLLDELEATAGSLRRHPDDRTLLTRVIALCHVIVEGVLAVPAEHFIYRYVSEREIMPGLTEGIGRIARDEARHVAFGMTLLGRLIRASSDNRIAAIKTWNRALPWMVGVFVPPNVDRRYAECFGFTLEEIYAFGLESFETKLEELGVPPEELTLLRLDDRSLSYEQRAARMATLIETRVLGDETKEPRPNHEALEILFEGTVRAVDLETARSLDGPIQWDFMDAEPWHVVVTDGHAEAKPGRVENAALTLEISAADWARVAVGRVDARWALLKRRLRVHGTWQAKSRLSKLFGSR